ncbi:hypothetical protein F5B21DRAFT_492257 [Xylaria acuta]|nr:hypothetical protein F5B21DRAFT_492257 [Xylaria acuta]
MPQPTSPGKASLTHVYLLILMQFDPIATCYSEWICTDRNYSYIVYTGCLCHSRTSYKGRPPAGLSSVSLAILRCVDTSILGLAVFCRGAHDRRVLVDVEYCSVCTIQPKVYAVLLHSRPRWVPT